jgi:hypothetical protein
MTKWIVAFVAGAAFAVGGPAHAERMLTNWVDVAQKPKLLTNDALMHKQLCATDSSDGSCTDGGTSAKDLLLAVLPTVDGPSSLNPIFETPVEDPPTLTSIPEPSGLLALAVGGAALFAFGRRRRID